MQTLATLITALCAAGLLLAIGWVIGMTLAVVRVLVGEFRARRNEEQEDI